MPCTGPLDALYCPTRRPVTCCAGIPIQPLHSIAAEPVPSRSPSTSRNTSLRPAMLVSEHSNGCLCFHSSAACAFTPWADSSAAGGFMLRNCSFEVPAGGHLGNCAASLDSPNALCFNDAAVLVMPMLPPAQPHTVPSLHLCTAPCQSTNNWPCVL